MKTIMILGASILQLPAIEQAKKMGLNVVVVDMNPNAVGFDVEGIVKEVISTIDTPAVLKAAKKHHIDGIMTLASDMPMQTIATVCKELGLVGISEETALKATNKAFMRDALKDNRVPIPAYYRVSTEEAFNKAVRLIHSIGSKCIVKPADNSGSRGVLLLDSVSDLNEAYHYTKKYSRDGELVIEEYMEGPEVSVETLAIDGKVHVIQITDKITTGAPYFVEMGHSQPSQFSDEIKRKIAEVAIAANKAIGIENGPSHTEIKVTKDGPKIVELGARLGGDCITTHLVPLSTGIDMVEGCLKIVLGENPSIQSKWNKGSAIRYFITNKGVVNKVEGVDDVRRIPGIVQVSIVHGVGECLDNIKSSVDRAGFVISQAENVNKAVEIAEMGVAKIKYVTT